MIKIEKLKGSKFRLKPTDSQIEYFMKCFGCKRKIYNIYVDLLYKYLEKNNYQNGFIKGFKFPTPAHFKEDYPYLKEIDSLALTNAQLNFLSALSKYNKEYDKVTYKKSAKKKEKTTGKVLTFRDLKGIPTFKSKKDCRQSFTTNNQDGTITILNDHYIRIPKLKTPILFMKHRELPNNYIIKNATIIKHNRYFYVSITVIYEDQLNQIEPKTNKIVGLDYSSTHFYVSSDGEIANYPHYYRQLEHRLKQEQRKLSKMTMKSKNWIKQKVKLSNGMFRNYLKYKLEDRNKYFIKIDKWFPSSKTCHACGLVYHDLRLSDRKWICPTCKVEHDRDYNASINIKNEGMKILNKQII